MTETRPKARGHKRAQRLYPRGPCERCGARKSMLHHKDGDPLNNAPANVERLCSRCHGATHSKLQPWEIEIIRTSARSCRSLGLEFSVSHSHVSMIKMGLAL